MLYIIKHGCQSCANIVTGYFQINPLMSHLKVESKFSIIS